MTEEHILHALGSVNDTFIEEMYALNESKKTVIHHHPARKLGLIAAILAAMVILMGCAIVCALRMENLKIANYPEDKLVIGSDGMHIIGTASVDRQILTLAGLKGTAGYQAAVEWYAFNQEYDPDRTIYLQVISEGNNPEFPPAYDRYGLYSQEMKTILDSIADKYGLKLQGARLKFLTLKNMCKALGVQSIHTAENNVTVHVVSGECYENGNFYLTLNFTLPVDEKDAVDRTEGTLMWNRKDCFSDDMVTMETAGDWEEWNYTTAAGNQVLIIRSESDYRGWIICDREEAILSIQIETSKELWYNIDGKVWADKAYLTDRQMEQIADAVDLSIQPRIATQEDVNNQPPVPNTATQNGYTVELKSFETDGYIAYITLRVTAPEGTIISRTTQVGYENEPYQIKTSNLFNVAPISGKGCSGSEEIIPHEDGDGLDYTQDFIIRAEMTVQDGSIPFEVGSTWEVKLNDLLYIYYDHEQHTTVEELLAEGEWLFRFTVDGTHIERHMIEFITEPIVTRATIGFKPDGTDVYGDVTVTSFSLHEMGASVLYREQFAAELTNNYDKVIYVVMKDGNKIQLCFQDSAAGIMRLRSEEVINLELVDHVLLADGTKLVAPQ